MSLFKKSKYKKIKDKFSWSTFMSFIQSLELYIIKYYFMKSIFKNESITTNNINIINELYLTQIDFQSDDS